MVPRSSATSLAAFCLVFCTVFAENVIVNSTYQLQVLNVGEEYNLICSVHIPIETCSIKFTNWNQALKVRENMTNTKFEYLGNGFEKGDCGLKYFAINETQNGTVTCTVSFPIEPFEPIGHATLIVALPPTNVELRSKNNSTEIMEGEEMQWTCTASGARPAPNVTLFLDNENVGSAEGRDTVSFNKSASFLHNNKKLVCKVTQKALMEPKFVVETLNVFFKPRSSSNESSLDLYVNFTKGRENRIIFDVFANPEPQFEWKISGDETDQVNFTHVDHNVSDTGAWKTELIVTEVNITEMDVVLTAINSYGNFTAKFSVNIEEKLETTTDASMETTFKENISTERVELDIATERNISNKNTEKIENASMSVWLVVIIALSVIAHIILIASIIALCSYKSQKWCASGPTQQPTSGKDDQKVLYSVDVDLTVPSYVSYQEQVIEE